MLSNAELGRAVRSLLDANGLYEVSRAGISWCQEEDEHLRYEVNVMVRFIAAMHKRNEGSIKSRMKQMISWLV